MDKNWTAGEVWAAREALEAAAATLLGRLLFEFSRLDVALGLCLVWVNDGRHIDALTPKVTEMTFHKKLDALTKRIDEKFVAESAELIDWATWVEQAHAIRAMRNQLTHGRWGVDPLADEAINVIGLPTSPEQREVRYTLSDLGAVVDEAKRLQTRLAQLRDLSQL